MRGSSHSEGDLINTRGKLTDDLIDLKLKWYCSRIKLIWSRIKQKITNLSSLWCSKDQLGLQRYLINKLTCTQRLLNNHWMHWSKGKTKSEITVTCLIPRLAQCYQTLQVLIIKVYKKMMNTFETYNKGTNKQSDFY
jgi:hypothetical protein